MKQKIINYLINELSKSLIENGMHRKPELHKFSLETMAKTLYYQLSKKEKNQIVEEINKK
jgi:hypothetical protein